MSGQLKDTILEALGSVIPEEAKGKISEAVEIYAANLKEGIEKEYNAKLEESFKQFDVKLTETKDQYEKELDEAEKVAESGYTEAANLIREAREEALEVEETAYKGYDEAKAMLTEQEETAYQGYEEARQMIEQVKTEYEAQAYKGYEEAYEVIKSLKAQNEQLESDLYEQYQKALTENREELIDKVDQFLTDRIEKVKEQIRTECAEEETEASGLLRQMFDLLKSHFEGGEEAGEGAPAPEVSAVPDMNSKAIEAMETTTAALKEDVKRLEAKNFRLLAEAARAKEDASKLLTEQTKVEETEDRRQERQERREKARLAEGNGEVVKRDEVVVENVIPAAEKGDAKVQSNLKASDAMVLAGIKAKK